jgi:hypothetical protein
MSANMSVLLRLVAKSSCFSAGYFLGSLQRNFLSFRRYHKGNVSLRIEGFFFALGRSERDRTTAVGGKYQ